MGPDQHAQLDGFGLTLPFPIRCAALLAFGELNDQTRSRFVTNVAARLVGMGS